MIEFNGGKIFGADYEFADGQARAEVGELKSAVGTVPTGMTVEGQINDLSSDLRGIENIVPIVLHPVFIQGKNINSGGVLVNNSKRIATGLFIDISAALQTNTIPLSDSGYTEGISYTIADGYRMYVAYYSDASESAFVSTEGWLTGSGKLTPTGRYMRMGYATVDDATTMTVELASNIVLSLNYTLKTVIDKVNRWGVNYKKSLSSSIDADDIVDVGVYIFRSASFPTNLPSAGNGTLIVVPSIVTESQSPALLTALMQICIYIDGKIWVRYARYSSGEYGWRDWVLTNPDAQADIVEPTKWLAVGDSITFGVYSYIGSGGASDSAVTTECWVRLLAAALNYSLTVMASRGMGYTVTGQDPDDSSLPRITLDTLLTRIEALTDDFNLVTLAFGINDYATTASTVEGIVSSFNSAVERLLVKFPSARLVVITPFNSCRAGSAESNWAYNTATGNKTLKDVADALKARCVAYGIEYIDASNGFLFNTFNIQGLQPDNTHPSLTGHKLIAKNMAHYLLN